MRYYTNCILSIHETRRNGVSWTVNKDIEISRVDYDYLELDKDTEYTLFMITYDNDRNELLGRTFPYGNYKFTANDSTILIYFKYYDINYYSKIRYEIKLYNKDLDNIKPEIIKSGTIKMNKYWEMEYFKTDSDMTVVGKWELSLYDNYLQEQRALMAYSNPRRRTVLEIKEIIRNRKGKQPENLKDTIFSRYEVKNDTDYMNKKREYLREKALVDEIRKKTKKKFPDIILDKKRPYNSIVGDFEPNDIDSYPIMVRNPAGYYTASDGSSRGRANYMYTLRNDKGYYYDKYLFGNYNLYTIATRAHALKKYKKEKRKEAFNVYRRYNYNGIWRNIMNQQEYKGPDPSFIRSFKINKDDYYLNLAKPKETPYGKVMLVYNATEGEECFEIKKYSSKEEIAESMGMTLEEYQDYLNNKEKKPRPPIFFLKGTFYLEEVKIGDTIGFYDENKNYLGSFKISDLKSRIYMKDLLRNYYNFRQNIVMNNLFKYKRYSNRMRN